MKQQQQLKKKRETNERSFKRDRPCRELENLLLVQTYKTKEVNTPENDQRRKEY